MVRILVLSDTHGNQQLLRVPFNVGSADYSHIFHLGDEYEDMDDNPDLTEGRTLMRVPGLYHPGYLSGALPRIQRVEVEGWTFLLAHSADDAHNADLTGIDVVLYGHTHKPGIMQGDGRAWCNPGHLKREHDRGHAAGWMVIELNGSHAFVTLYGLNGQPLLRETLQK